MPRHKGKLRKQLSVQCTTAETRSAPEFSSGSEADIESLRTMDSFHDARESPAVTNPNELVASTTPLIPTSAMFSTGNGNSNANVSNKPNKQSNSNWRSHLPAFLQRSNPQTPIITYTDRTSNTSNIELNNVGNGTKPRWGPSRSRSIDTQPVGSFFSDGVRLIDYVLAYDMDLLDDDEEDEQSDDEQKDVSTSYRSTAQLSAAEKRRVYENNLKIQGLELEWFYAKFSRTAFVCLHAPFKVLTKQAELLKIKMPVYQNDVKKVANLMDGMVNSCLKRIPFLDFNDDVKARIEPPDHFCQPFIEQHLNCFIGYENETTFFSRSQRSQMVYDILIRTRYDNNESSDKIRFGIDRLVKNRTYLDAYPLHEDLEEGKPYDPKTCSERKLLYENWVKPRNVWKYQPLHTIKNYFGTKIGFYFAWIGYYTRSLYAISVIGMLCFLFGLFSLPYDVPSQQICDINGIGNMTICPICGEYCDYTRLSESCVYSQITYIFDNFITVIFAAIMSIWATLFLEGWKRYHAELAYKWNVFDFEAEDEIPRPEFQFRRKHLRVNPVTQHQEPYIPPVEKGLRFTFSLASVLFFISLVVALIIGIMAYRLIAISMMYEHYYDKYDKNFQIQAVLFTSATTAVINLCAILVFNQIYNSLALKLTEMEYPRTQTEFDNSYTVKVFAFQFVNYYASLFYIAFMKHRRTYVIDVVENTSLFGYKLEQCDGANCMVELIVQLAVIMIGKQFVNAFAETCTPILWNAIRRWRLRLPENSLQRQERIRKESQVVIESATESVSLVERDYSLNPVTEQFLFDEYLEMVIQFGFCTLFVSAFPLAPFCALLNNVMEIRLDAYKFITTQRKPHCLTSRNIGIWFTILDLLSKLSVLCNACVIAFTSDFIPRLYYYMINHNLDGYIEDSMSFYDTQNIHIKYSQFNDVKFCRYRDFRHPPCSALNSTVGNGGECNDDYSYTNKYFILLVMRLSFVLVFEHLVLCIKGIVAFLIPDVPSKIVVQLQRERYLARQAVLQRADENSTLNNSSYRAQSGSETTDTEGVAYQPGVDAMDGQDQGPSMALKRMYSDRRRPTLSSQNSNLPDSSSQHRLSVNDSGPTVAQLPSTDSLRASSYDSFRTAPATPKTNLSLPTI
ncbi:Anoctamin [Aphelenchoides besseyi]|nr:Anoctamin [Aphelenchoides besseyi]